jgi:hypothetical protein
MTEFCKYHGLEGDNEFAWCESVGLSRLGRVGKPCPVCGLPILPRDAYRTSVIGYTMLDPYGDPSDDPEAVDWRDTVWISVIHEPCDRLMKEATRIVCGDAWYTHDCASLDDASEAVAAAHANGYREATDAAVRVWFLALDEWELEIARRKDPTYSRAYARRFLEVGGR